MFTTMMINTVSQVEMERGALPRVSKVEERLGALYAANGSQAARLAYLLTGDRDAVEDIVHEAFARVGRRLLGLRDPSRSAAYLYRTVVNLAKGHVRNSTRDRKLQDRMTAPEVSVQPDLAARDEVWRALMKLSQRQRTALYLRHYLDLPEAEAAEVMDLSVAAMKSLTHRAAEACRKELSGGVDDARS